MENNLDYLRFFELVERELTREYENHWARETAILKKHGLTWSDWTDVRKNALLEMGHATDIPLDHGTVIREDDLIGYVPYPSIPNDTNLPL